MSTGTTEIADFHQFLGDSLERGSDFATVEEALDAWRLMHPTDDDATDDLQAALAALHAGDVGVPLEEFDRRFRVRHGMNGFGTA